MNIVEDGYGGNNDPTPKITVEMVEDWVGSDNLDADSFLNLLTDLVNGKYTIENFRKDVLDYAEEFYYRAGKGRA
jgi:hypothetical protein